jgi:hypothetical protein
MLRAGAAGFVLKEGTVKTHVNHLFARLQRRDRAAAVIFAFRPPARHPGIRPGPSPRTLKSVVLTLAGQ